MLKTGIYSVDQLNDSKNFKTIFGNDKKISITLYPEIANDPEKSELAEQILLNFTDDRGAFKRTYANRFEEFDSRVLQEILSRFSTDDPLIVHDAAVSDGRTACDFFEKLKPHFPSLDYYASDYDPYIYVIEDGRTKIVMNKSNKPLEITFPPFVLNLIKGSRFYPVNQILQYILKKTLAKKILEKHKKNELKVSEKLLFCHKALNTIDHNSNFHLIRYNLLEPSIIPQPLHIFRAMNILNSSYFNPTEMKIIINQIFNPLHDNGLFITGSNQDSHTIVHGGIYIKNYNRFERLWNSGKGSPIDRMILDFRLT